MKSPKISDLSKRVLLMNKQWTTDAELNRIQHLVKLRTIWAMVETRSTVFSTTTAGERPETTVRVVFRKIQHNFTHIEIDGEIYELISPAWDDSGKYTICDVRRIDGKRRLITEFPQIVGDYR